MMSTLQIPKPLPASDLRRLLVAATTRLCELLRILYHPQYGELRSPFQSVLLQHCRALNYYYYCSSCLPSGNLLVRPLALLDRPLYADDLGSSSVLRTSSSRRLLPPAVAPTEISAFLLTHSVIIIVANSPSFYFFLHFAFGPSSLDSLLLKA